MALLLVLCSACGPKVKLKGVQAAPTRVESSVTTTTAGTVSAEQAAVLAFAGAGRVSRINVKAGDPVKKGDILAELENTDLKSTFANAQRELKRAQELFDNGLVSRAGLDDARRGIDVARANLDKSVVRAPFDGIVTEMNLEIGETPQAASTSGKAALRIVDSLPRIIRGDIDEIDLSRVKVGTPARVKIQAIGGGWMAAEVRKVVPFVSTAKERDRTSEIELKLIEQPEKMIPVGASVDIEIITEAKENVLAVPARVVTGKSGQRYVYKYGADGKLVRTSVKTGTGNYARMEILEGLSKGDVVVFPPDDVELKDGMRAEVETSPWP